MNDECSVITSSKCALYANVPDCDSQRNNKIIPAKIHPWVKGFKWCLTDANSLHGGQTQATVKLIIR